MRSRSPEKLPADAEFAHAAYDEHVETLFRAMGRLRKRRAQALAMLLYQSYASVHFGHLPFEREHGAIDPYEADVCKAIEAGIISIGDSALEVQDPRTVLPHGLMVEMGIENLYFWTVRQLSYKKIPASLRTS